MKRAITLALIFCTLTSLSATIKANEFTSEVNKPGLGKNKILIYGTYHRQLFGYEDQRYVGEDKGDYLKDHTRQFGAEFYKTGFGGLNPMLADIRFGGNINFYQHSTIKEKELYAVPGHSIPLETVPEDEEDRLARFRIGLGFFAGLDRKWFGVDLGLTARIKSYHEKERERLAPGSSSSDPVYEKTDGRGWVWDNGRIYPNFLLRLGLEDKAHFTISAFREDYNAYYGIIQTKLIFPVSNYFTFKLGGYLYPSDSIFVEPVFKLYGLELGTKIGTIINYRDEDITRVGIKDSLFGTVSLGYTW